MRSRDRAAGASINPQARAAHLEVHAKYGRDILGPTHQYQKQKEAAFTRGDAITGWNFATTRIANMHPVGIKRKHQATKQDLQAVAELDDPQNLSDTGYIT
ncbi:hypothetical protein WJX79_002028 [Trebouxia sp. C0005]